MIKPENKLTILQNRELVTTELGQKYLTKYENNAYVVFAYEEGEEIHISVLRKDNTYPEVNCYGVNVAATGTLSKEHLVEHIERLNIARETHEQIIELYEGVRIREY